MDIRRQRKNSKKLPKMSKHRSNHKKNVKKGYKKKIWHTPCISHRRPSRVAACPRGRVWWWWWIWARRWRSTRRPRWRWARWWRCPTRRRSRRSSSGAGRAATGLRCPAAPTRARTHRHTPPPIDSTVYGRWQRARMQRRCDDPRRRRRNNNRKGYARA